MTRQNTPTKVRPPRLYRLIPRERLYALLEGRQASPLVWIEGPPGAGKTALVASYLESRHLPVLWYQVDTGDTDPAAFFHYFSQGVSAQFAGSAARLPTLTPDHLKSLEAFTQRFFLALFDILPARAAIVFDNWQDLEDASFLASVVRTALAERPEGIRVFCLSREEPHPAFAMLAVSAQMQRIGWENLRLTLDETKEFVAARELSSDWAAQLLLEQSDGWIAGVTLMLERLAVTSPKPSLLPVESRRNVFDYFAALFFDQAQAEIRDVLLGVAVMPYVTAAMAAALSGQEDAGRILDLLYRRRFFIDRREGDAEAFHFHALFRGFLLARLSRERPPEQVRSLRIQGARLMAQAGDLDAAAELAIEAGDWPALAAFIQAHADAVLQAGRSETLLRWIEALPAAVCDDDPQVLYWQAACQSQKAPRQAVDSLLRALSRATTAEQRMDCLVALISNGFVCFVALDEMTGWLEQLLALVSEEGLQVSTERQLRLWGVLCSALFWIKPAHAFTGQAAWRVEAMLASRVASAIKLSAASNALATCCFCGEFAVADRIVSQTEKLAENFEGAPSVLIWWLNNVGFLRFFQGHYESALNHLKRAEEVCAEHGMARYRAIIALHRCAVEFRVLGWGSAAKILSTVSTSLSTDNPMEEAMYYLLEGRRVYSQGRKAEAAQLAQRGYDAGIRTRSQYQEMLFGLIYAEMLIAAGRVAEAQPLLSRSRAAIESTPAYDCWRAALRFVEAYGAHAADDSATALEVLKQAMILAAHGNRLNYLRHFECALPVMLNLLLEHGTEIDMANRIIRFFRLRPPEDATQVWPWRIRIATLGRFELRVDDQPVQFGPKVPKKTLALLKLIISCGGRDVPEQTICDALWADEEGDAAHEAMSITVFRLRKLLGVPDAITQQGGKLSLNAAICRTDALVFEERSGTSDSAEQRETLHLYQGAFLPEDADESWTVVFRERLKGRFVHLLTLHGGSLEQAGSVDAAADLYLRGIDADPIIEGFHQGVMRCYLAQGRFLEAISAYGRLHKILSAVLGVEPSAASMELLERARAGRLGESSGSSGSIVSLTGRRQR